MCLNGYRHQPPSSWRRLQGTSAPPRKPASAGGVCALAFVPAITSSRCSLPVSGPSTDCVTKPKSILHVADLVASPTLVDDRPISLIAPEPPCAEPWTHPKPVGPTEWSPAPIRLATPIAPGQVPFSGISSRKPVSILVSPCGPPRDHHVCCVPSSSIPPTLKWKYVWQDRSRSVSYSRSG